MEMMNEEERIVEEGIRQINEHRYVHPNNPQWKNESNQTPENRREKFVTRSEEKLISKIFQNEKKRRFFSTVFKIFQCHPFLHIIIKDFFA